MRSGRFNNDVGMINLSLSRTPPRIEEVGNRIIPYYMYSIYVHIKINVYI